MFSALFVEFDDLLPKPRCAIKIKLLRKNHSYANFLADRSEEKIPNFALNSVSTCFFFFSKEGIFIFMHII